MTFERFLHQYNAQGREKRDGYSAADFDSLTPDEQARAESLLVEAAERWDTTAFQGLSLLGTEQAVETLARIHVSLPFPSLAHLRASEALWNVTDDEKYQREIAKDLDTDDIFLFRQAVVALSYTRPTTYQFETMQRIFLNSRGDNIARSTACGTLIQYYGFAPLINDQTPERLNLQRKLMDADASTLQGVLNYVRARAVAQGLYKPA